MKKQLTKRQRRKRNPTDSTLRNVRAAKKREGALKTRIRDLEQWVVLFDRWIQVILAEGGQIFGTELIGEYQDEVDGYRPKGKGKRP